MRWFTKNNLRIDLAVSHERNRSLENEIVRLRDWVEKIENERAELLVRVSTERERADRLNDALLQQNGLPATTSTVRSEQNLQANKASSEYAKYVDDLNEIYGDMMKDTTLIEDASAAD